MPGGKLGGGPAPGGPPGGKLGGGPCMPRGGIPGGGPAPIGRAAICAWKADATCTPQWSKADAQRSFSVHCGQKYNCP